MSDSKKRGWRQWTAEDARRELSNWRASGKSLAAFVRERGYSKQRLRWWRDRLAQWDGPTAAPAPVLVPASLTLPAASLDAVVLRLPGGVVVEVGDTSKVSAKWLAAFARELLR